MFSACFENSLDSLLENTEFNSKTSIINHHHHIITIMATQVALSTSKYSPTVNTYLD
ncbi:MAG: hypothetical protein ACI8RD_009359, partial [Bacillariaceae sp.]